MKRIVVLAVIMGLLCNYSYTIPAYANPSEQFTVGAALPGSGTAINNSGIADSDGVFHINIPTAYTPGIGFYSIGFYSGGHHTGKRNKIDNSIGYLSAGFGENTRVFGSVAIYEKDWQDSITFNGQVELLNQKDQNMPAFAIGCQDIFNNVDFSLYGIATYKIYSTIMPVYLSAGYGGGRFINRLFGGLSAPIADSANIALEYDGFQFNFGIGYKPDGRFGRFTILGGYNDESGIMLGASYNF
ncbi:MAG: hypothetical protein SNJ70_03890 [Armatimonadota bacterium]